MIDIMIAPFFLVMNRFGASYKEYPNIKKYTDMMKVRLTAFLW